jgi:hypothetical protein
MPAICSTPFGLLLLFPPGDCSEGAPYCRSSGGSVCLLEKTFFRCDNHSEIESRGGGVVTLSLYHFIDRLGPV